ncbi:small HspC2 heat shock protein [Capsaspora owczarzaki ATCC 30864]|uniref:Small HspC2 heat shock protein n=1 Tax=Capsaspora owczarzaki (strain ATCC 30864) TaxID=595528 RepID=A0A0D2UFN1_CAPO3|nr:small HspC2 heat shock protein [Capsaspora owczarzaki ATCC 30864]KJE93946.1 small HspC2 heat shock protein [Capsaspora owczarzaki ATCC 30864]|eukprot:XP_004347403.1 small HspC2 heat shock protein [Capsaspora owczarzaki ATCC 30864]
MDFYTLRRDMDRLFNQFERGFPASWQSPMLQHQQAPMLESAHDSSKDAPGDTQVGALTPAWPSSRWMTSPSTSFAVDVHESSDGYHISADLPGMKKDEISVNCENGILTISGEKKQEQEKSDHTYHVFERSVGRVSRTLRLPRDADSSKANAKYTDGVLTLDIAKRALPAGSRIAIQ